MASIKQRVFSKLEKLGGTFDHYGPDHDYMFDAPKGFLWGANNGHCLVHFQYRGFGTYDFWVDVLDRMSYGVYPCDEINCEVCNETIET